MSSKLSRRAMITASAAGAAAIAASAIPAKTHAHPHVMAAVKGIELNKGATVLLQGDSITDAGRDKKGQDNVNDFKMLGNGYAKLIAYHLLSKHADKQLKIYNRGISGHKVPDLDKRWGRDCIDLKPDVVSILIGVNDMWHKMNGRYKGTPEDFESGYKALLKRTKDALPNVQLIVCEPFALRCGAVKDNWFPEWDQRVAGAKAAAKSIGATYVPFQGMFDAAVEAGSPPEHWGKDGVHPSAHGQGLMAARWLGETGLA